MKRLCAYARFSSGQRTGRGGGVAKIRRKGKSKQHHKLEQQHPQDTAAGRRISAWHRDCAFKNRAFQSRNF